MECNARGTDERTLKEGVRFLQLGPGEYFFTTVKVAGYCGLLMGAPVARAAYAYSTPPHVKATLNSSLNTPSLFFIAHRRRRKKRKKKGKKKKKKKKRICGAHLCEG